MSTKNKSEVTWIKPGELPSDAGVAWICPIKKDRTEIMIFKFPPITEQLKKLFLECPEIQSVTFIDNTHESFGETVRDYRVLVGEKKQSMDKKIEEKGLVAARLLYRTMRYLGSELHQFFGAGTDIVAKPVGGNVVFEAKHND